MTPDFRDDDHEDEAPPASASKRKGAPLRPPAKGALNFEDDDDSGAEFDDPEGRTPTKPRRRSPEEAAAPPRRKPTLVELSAPVFALTAMLPRDPGQDQPDYAFLRGEVMTALQTFEREAASIAIDPADIQGASYALAVFVDEAVNRSEWNGRIAWGQEPLGVLLHNDPIGGVNFFDRLERLGGRLLDLREVYMVCLALGFRGKLATDPQTCEPRAREIIERELAIIRPRKILPDKKQPLFPNAYRKAPDLDVVTHGPPKWWWPLSIGITVLAIALYVLLFINAGKAPKEAEEAIKKLNEQSAGPVSAVVPGGESTAARG